MLKAIGAGNLHLYRVVLTQATLSVALGLAVALAFTLGLAVVVPLVAPELALAVSLASLTKVAGLAAVLPIRQIAGLDPAVVFRGGA